MLRKVIKKSLTRYCGIRNASNGKIIVSSSLSIPNISSSISLPSFLMEKKFNDNSINKLIAINDPSSGRTMTYNEVYESTYKLASCLKKLGISKSSSTTTTSSSSCVAIMSPNHIHYFTCFHAIAITGAHR